MKSLASRLVIRSIGFALAAGIAPVANAQLVSSWAAPAFDDGNPSSDPVNSWLTDTTTGDIDDLPNVFGLRNLAADNARGRLYSAGGDFLITYAVDPDSNTDGAAELTPRVRILDQQGEPIGTPVALGFARGQLYAFASGSFFAIDPDTGLATSLPRPDGRSFGGIDYNPEDGLMYAVSGFSPNEEIVAFDLDTFTVTPVAVVPEFVYNFAALGSYNFDGVAVGEGKVFLTASLSDQRGSLRTAVYDIASGEFSTLPNPPRGGENRSYPGGATYFTGLEDFVPAGPSVIERGVQVRSADFEEGVLEIFNFNDTGVDLSGWKLRTEDVNEFRKTSADDGLDGVVIEAQSSVFVHYKNNAPAGDPDRLNRSAIGGDFALPFGPGAYVVQLLAPDSDLFFDLADHIQWNIEGQSPGSAGTRTNQAVAADLWTAVNDFITTQSDTTRIDLIDLTGNDAGSPGEYDVTNPGDFIGVDLVAPSGTLDASDMLAYLALFDATDPAADLAAPVGSLDVFDLIEYLAQFEAGRP